MYEENEKVLSEDEIKESMELFSKMEQAHPSIIPFLNCGLATVCTYPNDLPKDLIYHHYYTNEDGHIIMAIPTALLKRAEEAQNYYDYEVCLPVKYVLEKGYTIIKNGKHVVVDVPDDPIMGAVVDTKFNEF